MGILGFFQNKHCKIGDTVQFGRYYFESEKDVQPIEWIVLDDKKGELLMISKYCLDVIHYFDQAAAHDFSSAVVWEDAHLRNWLNNAFYNQAFTEKEKQQIIDTVIVTDETRNPALHRNQLFILSESQIDKFLPDKEKRKGFPTPYAKQQGAGAGIDTGEKAVWWWTMPVVKGPLSGMTYPAIVNYDGQVLYHSRLVCSPGSQHATVRPAIRIKK